MSALLVKEEYVKPSSRRSLQFSLLSFDFVQYQIWEESPYTLLPSLHEEIYSSHPIVARPNQD